MSENDTQYYNSNQENLENLKKELSCTDNTCLIMGVGGGGSFTCLNMIEWIAQHPVAFEAVRSGRLKILVVNTETYSMNMSYSPSLPLSVRKNCEELEPYILKYSIGEKVAHKGTGGNPQLGAECWIDQQSAIEDLIIENFGGKAPSMAIVCAIVGGGTGSFSLALACNMLKNISADVAPLVIAFPITPLGSFNDESRMQVAKESIEAVQASNADQIYLVNSDDLYAVSKKNKDILTFYHELISRSSRSILEMIIILMPSHDGKNTLVRNVIINRDLSDMFSLMNCDVQTGKTNRYSGDNNKYMLILTSEFADRMTQQDVVDQLLSPEQIPTTLNISDTEKSMVIGNFIIQAKGKASSKDKVQSDFFIEVIKQLRTYTNDAGLSPGMFTFTHEGNPNPKFEQFYRPEKRTNGNIMFICTNLRPTDQVTEIEEIIETPRSNKRIYIGIIAVLCIIASAGYFHVPTRKKILSILGMSKSVSNKSSNKKK